MDLLNEYYIDNDKIKVIINKYLPWIFMTSAKKGEDLIDALIDLIYLLHHKSKELSK